MMKKLVLLWLLVAIFSILLRCNDDDGGNAVDGGSDIDTGTSTETGPDSDSDIDADGDSDTDNDADNDSDTDSDADSDADSDGDTDADTDSEADAGIDSGAGEPDGELRMLTYNVAGLPDTLSSSNPEVNIPMISPLLNGYELVVVQEDFWYHDELAADAEHPYQSEPMVENPTLIDMGDGLNRFSVYQFGELVRTAWEECNGLIDASNDCLTPKGFSVAQVTIDDGVAVWVYNLHMDAGGDDGDIDARQAQIWQLIDDIEARTEGGALVVAGDTNMNESRPEDMEILQNLLDLAGMEDACRFLECGDERLDRIMFRSSDALAIEPVLWETPGEFVDGDSNPLSDHLPVLVEFEWRDLNR